MSSQLLSLLAVELTAGMANVGRDLVPDRFGLGIDDRQEFPEGSPHTVNLVDQIEDDRHALVVDAKIIPEIVDQLRPGEIDIGETSVSPAGQQPSGIDPSPQRGLIQLRPEAKFPGIHDYRSMNWRGL